MILRYLDVDDVPVSWRALHGYAGRTFRARVHEAETIECTAMQWSGGTRSTWLAFNPTEHQIRTIAPPRYPGPDHTTHTIEPGWLVVEHSIFCGKDMGLTFHIRPDMAAGLLPATEGEDPDVDAVCVATASLRNTYGKRTDIRYQEAHAVTGITRERWEAATERAIAAKLLRRNKSITPRGRNRAQEARERGVRIG